MNTQLTAAMEVTNAGLAQMTGSQMVNLFNLLTGSEVKKFSSREAGMVRVKNAALAVISKAEAEAEVAAEPELGEPKGITINDSVEIITPKTDAEIHGETGFTPIVKPIAEVLAMLKPIAQVIQEVVEETVAAAAVGTDLTPNGKQFVTVLRAALYNFDTEPDFSDVQIDDVAKGMGVSVRSAARICDRLVEIGIVEREEFNNGGEDRVFLHFTAAGRAYVLAGQHLTDSPKVGKRADYDTTHRVTLLTGVNPKKADSAAFDRFELYVDAMTVAEALAAGITRADLAWDTAKGFISVGPRVVNPR